MGVLYKLTAPNGKAYIGISSKGLEARWAKHVEHAMGKRSAGALYTALRKYGVDNFRREVLAEDADWTTLCEMERVAIRDHGTRAPGGYNVTDGGEGVVGPRSAEVRALISAAQTKRFQRPGERERLAEAGAKGAAVRQAKRAQHAKERHSAAVKAALARPEIRTKIERRAADPEWRAKISRSKTGRKVGPQSAEHRKAISDARKREWADPVMRAKRLAALARARTRRGECPEPQQHGS